MLGALSAKARDWHAESRRTRSRSRAGEIGAAVMLLMGFATSWGTVSAIFLRREAPIRLGSIQQKVEVERIISAFSASSRAKLPFPTPHSVALGPRCREDDDGVKMWWRFLARNRPEDVDWLAFYVICLAIGNWHPALQDWSREITRGCFRKISGSRRIMLVRQRPTEARRAKQPWPYPMARP
jgi:hypothetical protein